MSCLAELLSCSNASFVGASIVRGPDSELLDALVGLNELIKCTN